MRLLLIVQYFLILFFVGHYNILFSQEIKAEINISDCSNDKLHITIEFHNYKTTDSICYSFPKAIPGLYKIIDLTRFVSNFKAFSNSGKSLNYSKNTNNDFIIITNDTISRIEYDIDDTWDEEFSKNAIFYPAGTRFEENKFFFLNLYAIIGYFNENTKSEYSIKINNSINLNLITANKFSKFDKSTFIFNFNSYNELIAEPILLSKPDTVSFRSNNCTYVINTFSENLQINSATLSDTIKSVIEAVNSHFNDLVSDTFYINLVFDNWLENKGGGLEHKNSCVIVLSNRIKIDHLYFMIKEKIAHEYLHCITPLNLFSTSTKDFDFSGKTSTKLLWLYEGVTEYLSMKILLNKNLISSSKFLREIGCNLYDNEKMNDKNYSLEKLSSEILAESFNEFFMNFYYRGSLTAFAYDIWLQKQTNYNYNLTTLIKDIYKNNKSIPFSEDSIYNYLENYSKTNNSEFIDLYIRGNNLLPIKNFFKEIDLEIIDSINTSFKVLRYYITKSSNIHELKGDIYFIPDSSKSIFENDTVKIIEINNKSINKEEAVQNLMYANFEKFLNIKYETNKNIIQNNFKSLVIGYGNNFYLVLNQYKSGNNKFIDFINSN